MKTIAKLTVVLVVATTGCTKRFVVHPVEPPQNTYAATSKADPGTFTLSDSRNASGRPLNAGTLNVELDGMTDEMAYLGENLARVLDAQGIKVRYDNRADADVKIAVRTYRIRNLRTSGFSPYHTFTTFSADVSARGDTQRITAYFKNSKTPVWAFTEVERPCYQVPIDAVVKEIAAKLNTMAFGRAASTETVNRLAAAVPAGPIDSGSEQYLKVLELGYTNNPAAIEPLVRLTQRKETMVRAGAISALGMLRATEQFQLLQDLYTSSTDYVKAMALKSIGDLRTPAANEFIRKVRNSPDYRDENIREVADLYL